MPQWRKLHAKITESLDFNEMPDDFTRLVWVLLPLGLDREGRSIDNSALIKSKLMPMRTDITSDDVGTALAWFAAHGLIVRYVANGHGYFYVPTFRKHQGACEREAPSSLPAPTKPQEPHTESVVSESRPSQDLVVQINETESCLEESREEENRGEESVPPSPFPAVLMRFFEANAGRMVDQLAKQDIDELIDDLHIRPEWLDMASAIADERGKTHAGRARWGYLMGIFRGFAAEGGPGKRGKSPPLNGRNEHQGPSFQVI